MAMMPNFALMANTGNTHLKRALALAKTKDHDPDEVLALLKKADELGNAEAAYAIGTWYLFGKHVRKNFRTAVEHLQRAAARGWPNAAFDLAVCYEKGAGVPKDKAEAFTLYMKAARRGDPQAAYEVGRCFYWGIGTTKNVRAAEVWFEGSDEHRPRKVAAARKRLARRTG